MITVAILINGNPIVAKNAANTGRANAKGEFAYTNDAGETIWHCPEDGAVELAHKLLDTIRNDQKRSGARKPRLTLHDGRRRVKHFIRSLAHQKTACASFYEPTEELHLTVEALMADPSGCKTCKKNMGGTSA